MQSNYAGIPDEMKAYRQFVVWRYEERQGDKPTKVPYDPKSGRMASVDDPSTWADFDVAVKVANSNPELAGIGFVLTERDPYAFIDLDGSTDPAVLDRQRKIFDAFDSYAELSPSGVGCHIIIKAHVPRGRKRSAVELYSSLRYMTMTGNVVAPKPIAERQALALVLWDQMGKDSAGNTVAIDAPQTEDDNMILVRAMNATNGLKFTALLQGNWQQEYASQSEADFALIDIIAYYTQNREQIIRLFRSSALGQRDKAKRVDYVSSMVDKSFDRMLAPQDFELFKITAANLIAEQNAAWTSQAATAATGAKTVAAVPGQGVVAEATPRAMPELTETKSAVNPYVFPPGLLGHIADYIYRSAPRPVPEIALAGAIGLMSGICGRTYQTPTGVALNLYTLLIAKSGRGKEAMQQGIWRIMHGAARLVPTGPQSAAVPAITQFVGPTDFRSDAALTKELSTRNCFVSIMGEFGLRLQAMVAPNVSSHLLGLKSVMLDLYHKADRSSQMSEMVYSDKEKNTKAVYRPSFSILAETTPSTYYEALSESLIMQGLLSRFFTVEYPGPRPDLNTANTDPSVELLQHMSTLAVQCLSMMNQQKVVPIEFDKPSYDAQFGYNRKVDRLINSSESDAYAELWNRAHLKALKLASLVAVGINPHHPVVTREAWEWAQGLVDADVTNTVTKFSTGQVGKITGNDEQNRDLTDCIIEWYTRPFNELRSYCGVSEAELMHSSHVIPLSYLSVRVGKLGSFRNDKQGSSRALYNTLRQFVQSGLLIESKASQFKFHNETVSRFRSHGMVYAIADETSFRDRVQGRRRGFADD